MRRRSTSIRSAGRAIATIVVCIAGCSAPAVDEPSAATSPTPRPHPTEPAWSHATPPVARFAGRIAFIDYDAETSTSAVYSVDGTGRVARISSDPSVTGAASWSPDGSSLAVTRDVCPPAPTRCATIISILTIATGTLRDLTPVEPGVGDFRPRFSPDGRRLVFASTRSVDDAGGQNLFTVNVDGSALTGIPIAAENATGPSWSADGAWIRYVEQSGFDPSAAFLIRPDGSERQALPALGDRPFSSVAWSPDGSMAAYTTDSELQPAGGSEFVTVPEIWLGPSAGGESRAVVPWPWHGSGETWAPDGMSLAFIGGGPSANEGLYISGLTGEEPSLVSTPDLEPADVGLAWTETGGG